ncbi:MAG: hypothetical protein OXB97_07780 [Rhodospirillales bacterium]|nr:hypothetical protein [Rhodospirillales bacterium]
MSRPTDRRAPAPTFLIHQFGRGLVDEGRTYAVERFRSMSNGEVRRWPLDAMAAGNGRARAKPEVATFDEVREMRPAGNEIIVCTALGTSSGVHYYGDRACGFVVRRAPLR